LFVVKGSLEEAYEVTVSASISDVAFFASTGHGYLLALTSADDDDIITINLATGKVDKIRGENDDRWVFCLLSLILCHYSPWVSETCWVTGN
jgi:hypothetical protein